MRKSLLITLALLFVAIAAPIAQADSFTYTYSDTFYGFSWTTAAISAVTMETSLPGAALTATSTSGITAGCGIADVTLDANAGGPGGTATDFSGATCGLGGIQLGDGFALTDYSTPGTYVSSVYSFDTLVVTAAVAAPEPSSVALMLAGIGLLLVMRKRIGQGLPRAS